LALVNLVTPKVGSKVELKF